MQALYRKYRPQTFSQMCGQDHITKILQSQIESSSPSHAYLFTGSRGTGKTSSAKILAKAVNCLSPQNGDPCCECEVCRNIAKGTVMEVVEIDAASNNSVASVRELCENVSYPPASCKYKVYIIDEVHMLTKDAFNALLKTLEEPPAHVIFILATTEVHEVPATILSRCQRFDFNRAPADVIAGRVKYVCECEKIEIDDDAAMLIAKLSDGGFRDALSLLDLCSASGSKITTDTVAKSAGLTGRDALYTIGKAINENDIATLLKVVADLYEKSCDMMRLCVDLTEYYRNIMVAKAVPDPSDLINESPDEIERIKSVASGTKFDTAAKCTDLLGECIRLMKQGKNKRVSLETTLIKMCMPEVPATVTSSVSNEEIKLLQSRLDKLEKMVESGVTVKKAETPTQRKPAPVKPTPNEKIDYDKAVPLNSWPDIIEKIKEKSMMLATVLKDSAAYTLDELLLIDVQNPDFAQMVNSEQRHRDAIRSCTKSVTGQSYRLAPYRRKKPQASDTTEKLDTFINENNDVVSDVTKG